MAEVRLQDVRKAYGDTEVVRGLTLRVADREFLTLIGPSGCGKSTTLNMIAGLEEVGTGEIYFGERRVTDVPPEQREAAMVFQSYALYPHKTVFENIAFPLRIRGMNGEEIDRRVRQVAATLELAPLLDRRPGALSGGQRQRVALGRALVRPAAVFLLDEPLSNLDAQLRVHMRAELKRLHADLRLTMIYVTHDQAEAMTMSDRVAVLHAGVLQQCDAPRTIYQRPVNRFVAGFMGSPPMNFLDGQLAAEGAGARLGRHLLSLPAPIVEAARSRLGPEGTVVLGIRPEHATAGPAARPGGMIAEVYVVEPLGHVCYVTVMCEGYRLTATAPADFDAMPGAPVCLWLDPEHVHLFDPATGTAIR